MLLLLASLAQGGNCRDVVTDDKKRGFETLAPLVVDVDGDGKVDTITPRTYTTKSDTDQFGRPIKVKRWITFDLTTSKGKKASSFFKFNYGTDLADYWVYALIPCDVNRDGRMDLIFYSGDDEGDDTVNLLNRNGRFVVHSRKHTEGS